MFLAAIMVISVLAMPIAFAGGAAAVNADDIDDDFDREVVNGSTVFQGQILAANVSDDTAYDVSENEDIELRRYDSSDDEVGGLVSTLTVENDSTGDEYVIIETENRDEDQYVLTEQSRGDSPATDEIIFEVVEQDLDVDFDEDTVADDGDEALVDFDIDSDARNAYAVNVSADGLDDDELVQIFQLDDNDENEDVANRSSIAQAVSGASLGDFATIDDDDEVLTLLRGENEWELNFTDIDEGEYEFDVEVVDATASASDSIEVEDRGDGEAVVEAAEVFQGDVVEFEVELDNTDNAALIIGDEDDDGYQANVSITDADEDTVTVFFNTYTAGFKTSDSDVTDDDIVFGDSDQDADVELTNGDDADFQVLSDLLDSGDYTVFSGALSTESPDESDFFDVFDDPDEVTTLTINDRDELDATQWRAGSDTIDDLLDVLDDEDEEAAIELIGEAVENDLVTETDMFAVNDGDGTGDSDYQIHQIGASGLEGLIANESDDELDDIDTTAGFAGALGVDNQRHDGGLADDYSILFELEEQNPGANQDPIEISLNEIADGGNGDVTDFVDAIIYDENANYYYVVIDTDELVSFVNDDNPGDFANEIEEDQEYEVTFAVQDARLLEETDDQDDLEDLYENVEWEFDLEEAEGEFLNMNDNDEVEAEAIEDEEIMVETNVAPGTELDIRTRNKQGTSPSFIKNDRDIVVGADGVVTGNFDFSAQSVDDEFTASVRQASFELEEDGIIVDSVEDVDDDDADDADDEADDEMDDMDDDVDADDEDDTVEETEDDTPGFGALVALLAVLGAAFLATRRQN